MTEQVSQIAVDSYLPATEVGRHFGYTKDYILQLIKQGKIEAKKVGNKWHVDPASAEHYFEVAKIEREKYKQRLREERKAELKNYLPATEVGRHFGYTKDYILMLIKQGKIDGKKVKNKWHADLESAETYFETAKREREERRKRLSAARKVELRASQSKSKTSLSQDSVAPEQIAVAETATQVSEEATVNAEENDELVRTSSFVTPPRVAVLQTLLILFVGLSVGVLGYAGVSGVGTQPSALNEFSFFERMAIAVHETFSPHDIQNTITYSNRSEVEDVPVQSYSNTAATALSMKVGTTTHTSVILSDDEVMTATTVETVESSIQKSFSDDVEVVVDTNDSETVLVTPKFIDGDGETQRFKIVPIDYEDNSGNQ